MFGVPNARSEFIHIDYDSDDRNDFILKQIRSEYPKFEKCEFKTESDKHLGNIKSFENIQGNDKQAKIVYVHVSKLPNNIETINSLSDLGYLENILPTKKNNETYGLCFI